MFLGGSSRAGTIQIWSVNMRKIVLAVLAGTAGLVAAAAPSFAYTTYQVQTDGANAAKFTDRGVSNASDTTSGFSFSTGTSSDGTDPFDPASRRFNNSSSQQTPSRDMNWQGTGYYLRPSN